MREQITEPLAMAKANPQCPECNGLGTVRCFTKIMDGPLFNFFDRVSGGPWPRWLRRLFIITFPVSLPILLCLMVVMIVGFTAAVGFDAVKHYWK